MSRLPLLLGLLLSASPALAEAELESDSIVILHGLGRGPWAMKILEHRLSNAGYQVYNLGYPRRADAMDAIVAEVQRQYLDSDLTESPRVHFVTHSLGGLVLRAYLARHRPANLGRVVMLAPPNSGSEIVDTFGHWRLFRTVLGPLSPKLGTGPMDLPARLPLPDCEVGVVAGDRWINPVGPFVLPSPHDGTVSVEGTRFPEMTDHLIVPHTHTFIMNSKRVAREVIHFLRYGRFAHAQTDAA